LPFQRSGNKRGGEQLAVSGREGVIKIPPAATFSVLIPADAGSVRLLKFSIADFQVLTVCCPVSCMISVSRHQKVNTFLIYRLQERPVLLGLPAFVVNRKYRLATLDIRSNRNDFEIFMLC